jgi:hypothetical protein
LWFPQAAEKLIHLPAIHQSIVSIIAARLGWWCQANENRSSDFANAQTLDDAKLAPFVKSGAAHRSEPGASLDVSLVIAVIVHRTISGNRFV